MAKCKALTGSTVKGLIAYVEITRMRRFASRPSANGRTAGGTRMNPTIVFC